MSPTDSHVLHTKWVFKTKNDADGKIESYKARIVACGNERLFVVDYGLIFAAVMKLSTIKVVLVLARKWGVPARHRDIPNAYVKEDKGENLEIYLHIPQGMKIHEEDIRKLGADTRSKIDLRLKKSLYGLMQAGRLGSQQPHGKLEDAGFTRCTTEMCLYYNRSGNEMIVEGVYVVDILVTATLQTLVEAFFPTMGTLSLKDLSENEEIFGNTC